MILSFLSVTQQMWITFSSLDSIPRLSHEIALEYNLALTMLFLSDI